LLLTFCSSIFKSENLCAALVEVLEYFGITKKINAIVCDNASNMERMIILLREELNNPNIDFIRCLAHVIHILYTHAMKSLKLTDEQNVVGTLRRFVNATRSSPQRRQKFKNLCIRMNKSPIVLTPDVETRWSSTHEMIIQCLDYRLVIRRFLNEEVDIDFEFSTEDWQFLKDISIFLEGLATATSMAVVEHSPTLSSSLQLHHYLEHWLAEVPDILVTECVNEMAQAARVKLAQYYPANRGFTYAVATVVDPRFNIAFFPDTEGRANLATQILSLWQAKYADKRQQRADRTRSPTRARGSVIPSPTPDLSPAVAPVPAPALQISPQAISFSQGTTSSQLTSTPIPTPTQFTGARPSMLQYRNNPLLSNFFVRTGSRPNPTSAMERYMKMEQVDVDFDILHWWRVHGSTAFPSVALMARDYLAIPATSASIERVFSGGRDLVHFRRSALNEESIRACMCLKSWLTNEEMFL
jgi:hypothetical protein